MQLDPTLIRRLLEQLSHRPRSVFGADGHGFRLNPVLTESQLSSFEKAHSIALPPDYRHFLATIGNGGAGPYYGVFPLGMMDGVGSKLKSWSERDDFVGVLSRPFVLHESWNDLSGFPSNDLLETNEEEYDRQQEQFEKLYWDSQRINGAIPICHMGCALRVWLVVTGDAASELWRDGRSEHSGFCPILARDGQRSSFSTWYLEWLCDPEFMR